MACRTGWVDCRRHLLFLVSSSLISPGAAPGAAVPTGTHGAHTASQRHGLLTRRDLVEVAEHLANGLTDEKLGQLKALATSKLKKGTLVM